LELEEINEEVKEGTSLALFFLQKKSQNITKSKPICSKFWLIRSDYLHFQVFVQVAHRLEPGQCIIGEVKSMG